MNQAIRGTSAQLAGRLMLNGQRLDQPSISFLTRLFDGNGVKRIDTVRTTTGRGGKPAVVWEFDPTQFKLDMKMGRKSRSANDDSETGSNASGSVNGSEPKRRRGRPTNEERAQRQASQQPQGDLAAAIGAAVAQQMAPVVDQLNKLTAATIQAPASDADQGAGSDAGKGNEGAQPGGEGNGSDNGGEGNETAGKQASAPASTKQASASKSASKSKGKAK